MQNVFNNTNKSDSFKKFPGFILEQGISKGEMMFVFFLSLYFLYSFPQHGFCYCRFLAMI